MPLKEITVLLLYRYKALDFPWRRSTCMEATSLSPASDIGPESGPVQGRESYPDSGTEDHNIVGVQQQITNSNATSSGPCHLLCHTVNYNGSSDAHTLCLFVVAGGRLQSASFLSLQISHPIPRRETLIWLFRCKTHTAAPCGSKASRQ